MTTVYCAETNSIQNMGTVVRDTITVAMEMHTAVLAAFRASGNARVPQAAREVARGLALAQVHLQVFEQALDRAPFQPPHVPLHRPPLHNPSVPMLAVGHCMVVEPVKDLSGAIVSSLLL